MAQIGKKHFTKAGFTLVETLIVSVIVVLLIALAYPALEKVRDKYRERAIVENLEKVVVAGLQYIEEKRCNRLICRLWRQWAISKRQSRFSERITLG